MAQILRVMTPVPAYHEVWARSRARIYGEARTGTEIDYRRDEGHYWVTQAGVLYYARQLDGRAIDLLSPVQSDQADNIGLHPSFMVPFFGHVLEPNAIVLCPDCGCGGFRVRQRMIITCLNCGFTED